MSILYYDLNRDLEAEEEFGAVYASKEKLFHESDFVSVHLPLSKETRHFIGRNELKMMKPTAILVNTARGGIIEETALSDVLAQKALFGAGLDVFEEEPLSLTSPLRQLDNVVLTPHLGYATTQAVSQTWVGSVQNILRFMKGQTPHWIVNPQAQRAPRR